MSDGRVTVAFLLPHFRAGGAERVVLHWLGALDRGRFRPLLMLGQVEGEFLEQLPADVTPIALGGGRALRRPLRIARALRDHRVDVAYSATSAMNLALLAAPVRGGCARLVSEHTPPGAYLREAKLPLLRRLAMRLLYPRAATVLVPTRRIADELAAGPAGRARFAVVPNPVLPAGHAPLPHRPGDGAFRLVSAGRLTDAKGFDVLLEAVARLASDRPIRLTILGDGPLAPALRRQIEAAGLAGVVTLAGYVPDLRPALAEADLFVLASRREGFGNVLVEAMAAGCPVLATRSGGPETFIEHGRNGFLVPPDDLPALAAAIATLADDPVARAAVVEPARATAAGYGVEPSTRALEALVECVLNRGLREW